MQKIKTARGVTVSFDKHGSGPLLVHGGSSDHRTNWESVLPALAERFTTYGSYGTY